MTRKRKKWSTSELLRLACIYAWQNQQDFYFAVLDSDPELAAETLDYMKQLEEYRLNRWGKTKLEAKLDNLKSVPALEVLRRFAKEAEDGPSQT